MKKLIYLFLFVTSCASSSSFNSQFALSSLTEKEKNDIECRIIFTDSLDNNYYMFPVHDYLECDVKEKDSICVYIRYFNLYRTQYYEKIDFLDSTGKIIHQSTHNRIFKNSTSLSWNCWNWIRIDKVIFKDGEITVKVYLNNEFISEKKFQLKIL